MSNRLIYLIEEDPQKRSDLAEQIGHYGYGVTTFESIEQLKAVSDTIPAVIIASMNGTENEMHVTDVQHSMEPPPAIIFIADTGDTALRLRSVRFGALGYFTRPINIDGLVGLLDKITSPPVVQRYRVMIVESDAAIAAELDAILKNSHIDTFVVSDPMEILSAGAAFQPELILMNLYYPTILGMELAAVLRQKPEYERVPIVFQSSDSDPMKQMLALQKGGDDCLTRPLHPEYLALVIASRIEATRTVKSLLHRDGLTGLLNHRAILDSLEMKMELAGAMGKELPFVMVDIDKFKKINDTYGHPVGDMVLKSLGRLLKQRVWSKDLVGRLGGEEFGVIVNSMDGPTAMRVFDEIRLDFSQIRHSSQAGDFYATISCGVACYPRYATSADIEDAAERAVRHVKGMGGNRVGVIR